MHRIWLLLFALVWLFIPTQAQVDSTRHKPFVPPHQFEADLLLYNANIFLFDSLFREADAMVIHEGRIMDLGSVEALRQIFKCKKEQDMHKRYIYPGFNDAHAHFFGFAVNQLQANLIATSSFNEVLQRVKGFADTTKTRWVVGRGWDQNDWTDKQFPDKTRLDSLFPDRPVYLTRIDGHAALVNSAALKLAGITPKTKVSGGMVEVKNGECTGILLDEAMTLVKNVIPPYTREQYTQALVQAQTQCFNYGITSLADAGLDHWQVQLLDSLQQAGVLNLRIYAMLNPTQENMAYYLPRGIYKTPGLHVRSFKVYADGALGSRGACLRYPYADDPGNYGLMMHTPAYFDSICSVLYGYGFQVNTHAIGDSANRVVLHSYIRYLEKNNDRRWRIEHAQVVDPYDYRYFNFYNIIPSVQPTHCTSDMYWAGNRLGDRVKYAYCFRKLMLQNGRIAFGTDFPVESPNPLYTFYAAVTRQDLRHYPEGGFQPSDALPRKQTLLAMTLWPAYAAFEEREKGTLEGGKLADLVVMDINMMSANPDVIAAQKIRATMVGGVWVYER